MADNIPTTNLPAKFAPIGDLIEACRHIQEMEGAGASHVNHPDHDRGVASDLGSTVMKLRRIFNELHEATGGRAS